MSTPPLSEKDFIHEEYSKNPRPIWLWFFIVISFTLLIWGIGVFYSRWMTHEIEKTPFLQVTNRQFSLFLWQNPSFMRINMPIKTGYLPGFQYQKKISIFPEQADQNIITPLEILFLYHTWHRLLSSEFTERPIPIEQFREFLDYAQEWQPKYWSEAPEGYKKFVETQGTTSSQNLANLPLSILPLEVRQAFQGWKNYFEEGDEINLVRPTYGEIEEFLREHPNYARNYWQNIVDDQETQYLKKFSQGLFNRDEMIPENELTVFLKVAFFNAMQAKKGI